MIVKNTGIYANTISGTLPASDLSLDWQTLPMPEAGDLLELMLLYQYHGKFTKEYDQLPAVYLKAAYVNKCLFIFHQV